MVEKKKDIKKEEEVIEGEVIEEESKEKALTKKDVDETTESKALVPSAENILRLADALYQSGMFPNVKNKYGALAIIEYGRELGIQPVISLQTMSVINGKICMEAKTMMAMAERNKIGIEILEKSKQISRVKFTKRGKEPFTEEFTIKDAERMGFLKKSNWQLYPEEMLFWRCISKGLRAYDPGSILGLYSTEEMEMLEVKEEFTKPKEEKKKSGPKPKEEPEPQVPPDPDVKVSEAREEAVRGEELPPEVTETEEKEEKDKPPQMITEDTAMAIEICMESLRKNYKRDIGKLVTTISSRVESRFQFVPKEIPKNLTEEAGLWVLKVLNYTIKDEHMKASEKEKIEEETF